MDPITGMIAGQVLSAGLGAIGANQAANAQEDAAKQQAEAARRNMLYQTMINEPSRWLGYNALGDISSEFGYSMAPYASPQQLAQVSNPITGKAVARALRRGMSFDQIMQMGTLNGTLNPKTLKRLTRAGLSPEQIQQLSMGSRVQSAPQTQGQPTQQAPVGRGFMASPDYQFRRDEGTRGIANSFAARGGAASGNALRALADFNSGLASSEYGNWFDRRARLAGFGSNANAAQGSAANNYTSSMQQSQQNSADARASGVMGGVNSVSSAINNGLNGYLAYNYLRGQQNPMSGFEDIRVTTPRIPGY